MAATPDAPSSRPSRKVKSRNGFTRQHYGGPAAHKEAVSRARKRREIALRRPRAWRLLVEERLTFVQIGKRLGVSDCTAHKDCVAHAQALEHAGLVDSAFVVARIQAGIDGVINKHWPKRDRVESGRLIVQALDREAKLHGADRQRQGTYTVEQFVAVLRQLARALVDAFPAEADRRVIVSVVRRLLPAGDVVEVASVEGGRAEEASHWTAEPAKE